MRDDSGLFFPSLHGKELSDATLSKRIKALGFKADVHGFDRRNPWGAVAAALAFGVTEAARIRLPRLHPGVPCQAFVLLPFVPALAGRVSAARSVHLPAALAIPFDKDRPGTRQPAGSAVAQGHHDIADPA